MSSVIFLYIFEIYSEDQKEMCLNWVNLNWKLIFFNFHFFLPFSRFIFSFYFSLFFSHFSLSFFSIFSHIFSLLGVFLSFLFFLSRLFFLILIFSAFSHNFFSSCRFSIFFFYTYFLLSSFFSLLSFLLSSCHFSLSSFFFISLPDFFPLSVIFVSLYFIAKWLPCFPYHHIIFQSPHQSHSLRKLVKLLFYFLWNYNWILYILNSSGFYDILAFISTIMYFIHLNDGDVVKYQLTKF